MGLYFGGQTIKYRELGLWIKLGSSDLWGLVFFDVVSFFIEDILCYFMEGLGMSPETMRVLNKVKVMKEMKKSELHARIERVIRESLSDFELGHLEVRVTNVSEGKYSVEVDYGEDSSLIRREKTSQLDKSNKFKGCDKWKIPEGGQIRLLKDCSFGYPRHYRVNSEAEFSPEDVEKIKESWRKAGSTNCHEIKKVEGMFVKNVIGIDWGEGALEKIKSDVEIAEPVAGSEGVDRGICNLGGVKPLEEASEGLEGGRCDGCGKWNEYQSGSYLCWECK